jgi:ribonucleoside-triphosphate reductase
MDYNSDEKEESSTAHVPKRAKMIFSVMANPNRIEILRILNARGPLTYSELKANVGFKSKRESGKFAYHLRKLLRHSLVSLNKAERRYVITNRGKLILNITKQIEERSVMESGNIYVRTRSGLEEFNADEIVQSLVRETNMPRELADKIAEEVESRIHKMQGAYITSQLIRDIVNSLLLEHNSIDYRNRFLTIGMPYADISNALSNSLDYDSLQRYITNSVLRDYFLFNTIPKDVIDMHLNGDINISNIHTWGILPDTILVNLKEVLTMSSNIGMPLTSSNIDSMNDLYASACMCISFLSKHATDEVVIHGIDMLSRIDAEHFAKMLMLASINISSLVTLVIDSSMSTNDVTSILDGYLQYIKCTPLPSVALTIPKKFIDENMDRIADLALLGGLLSINNSDDYNDAISYKGIKLRNNANIVLHNISINAPRLAYESNNDELYFMTKVMLLLKPVIAALHSRSTLLLESIKKSNMHIPTLYSTNSIRAIINMVDLYTAVAKVLKKEDKFVDIARNVSARVVENSRKVGYEASVGIIDAPNDALRFSTLDAEKYGRNGYDNSIIADRDKRLNEDYSSGIFINTKDLLDSDERGSSSAILSLLNSLDNIFHEEGITVTLDVGRCDSIKIRDAINQIACRVRNFRIVNSSISICSKCRAKYYDKDGVDRCLNCNAYMRKYYQIVT